jgi:hypothetical protein
MKYMLTLLSPGVEIRQQGEHAGWPAVGDQQNQVEVDDTDDPTDKEATEALPATQLEIDKHRSRLRGIRTQQLPGRQTKTTQYRVEWGEHPNTSDSWVNEDDVQISMPPLPCERFFQNSVPQVERDSAKARFSSTWSMSSPPGSLKINCESHSVLCYLLSLEVTSYVMSVLFWKS